MVRGSCLCGGVVWELEGPLELMAHCHCSRCRKSHGSGFATYVTVRAEGFRFAKGRETIERYESLPGFFRSFCRRCGSVVPYDEAFDGRIGSPAGPLEGDLGVRPLAHIFVGSKAPWLEIADALPRFDAFPPGFGAPVLPDRAPADPPDGIRGSCLCSAVGYAIGGELLRAWNCHCSRCRKARAAAHASNLFVALDGFRWTRGEGRLASYKIPEALRFAQTFCTTCGSPMPRVDGERGLAVVPMGGLDDDPGLRPERHIFAAFRAPWFEIGDELPQHDAYPP
jgi:hypothetical protein